MKLYIKPGACSLSPHIVLNEAGLDYSVEKVDLATKQTENGVDFLQINPKGQVPALTLDEGGLLTEGVAIVQYLADRVPDKHLMPQQGTLAHYHALEWLNYISTELHKGFVPLFQSNTPEAYSLLAKEKLNKQFHYLNDILAKQDYILGDSFSVADAYLFTVLGWAGHAKLDLSQYAAIQTYLARIAARPAVQKTLKAEGLIS